jgi:hypothetical protein
LLACNPTTRRGSPRWPNDGSQLSADAQAALNDPPPACRSTGNQWFRQAMSEYATAGQDMVTGARQVQGGNYSGADTALRASNTATREGTVDLAKATAAMNNEAD